MEKWNDPKIIGGSIYQSFISTMSTSRYVKVKTSPQGREADGFGDPHEADIHVALALREVRELIQPVSVDKS